jgi:hypothetical protein
MGQTADFIREKFTKYKNKYPVKSVCYRMSGNGCMIVSWNFKHIVHFEKISKYNAVNTVKGYSHLDIFSPSEVIRYDDI